MSFGSSAGSASEPCAVVAGREDTGAFSWARWQASIPCFPNSGHAPNCGVVEGRSASGVSGEHETGDVNSMEEAFGETETAAGVTVKAASRVLSQALALVKSAQSGNVAAIRRAGQHLDVAFSDLVECAEDACESWTFDEEEEQQFFETRFVAELKAAAAERGLTLLEREGLLMCYPSIVRALAGECAVRMDRKKVSTVRPSFLASM